MHLVAPRSRALAGRFVAFVVALPSAGCAVGVHGTAGVTVDSRGHVGLFAKATGATGLDLSAHRAGQRSHGSASFFGGDLTAGYDATARSPFGFIDVRLSGSAISDAYGVALTPSAGVRIGGYAGEAGGAMAGPTFGLRVQGIAAHHEGRGCQVRDAPHRHRLLGADLDVSWLVPTRERTPPLALLTLGPSYGMHSTFAFCFSERTPERQRP